eukprot:s2596_g6.t1
MDRITVWLALTPQQISDLNSGKEIEPDEYSQRFGLRVSAEKALERARYFMEWTPEGEKSTHHPKEYTLVQIEITAIGYMTKMEADQLVRTGPGEYRWYGEMIQEERDYLGRLLYRFSDTAAMVI